VHRARQMGYSGRIMIRNQGCLLTPHPLPLTYFPLTSL
jgi:hypothetical protein